MSTKQISYKSGYKYQLYEMYMHQIPIYYMVIETRYLYLNTYGLLVIKPGYAWDGPSGPAIDTHTFMRGSLVHDALYQLIREKHLPDSAKDIADRLLREICINDGMNSLRAWWVYYGVKLFAGFAAAKKSIKKVLTAP